MYKFTIERIRQLYEELNKIIPIRFETVNNLEANAIMEDGSENVLIKYRNNADEQIDILHELIHVQMFYKDCFCKLAWRTDDIRVTEDLKRTVFHIRNIVDDTYVFFHLYYEYNVFPISPKFFKICKDDYRRGRIQLMEAENGVNKTLMGAWRLRMAELSTKSFEDRLRSSDKGVCMNFIRRFSDWDHDIERLVEVTRSSVKPEVLTNPYAHAKALEILRDYLGYSSEILYLARHRKIGDKFVLERT